MTRSRLTRSILASSAALIAVMSIVLISMSIIVFTKSSVSASRQADVGDAVKVSYIGYFDNGSVFDSVGISDDSYFVLTIGNGSVIPGFEDAITGMSEGETKSVHIPFMDAYGPLTFVEVRDSFPSDVAIGYYYSITTGNGTYIEAQVIAVGESTVTLQNLNPLAGQNLNFDITLVEIVYVSWADIVSEIDDLVPGTRITLDSITSSIGDDGKKQVEILGNSSKRIYAYDFVVSLEDSPFFTSVDFEFGECPDNSSCTFSCVAPIEKAPFSLTEGVNESVLPTEIDHQALAASIIDAARESNVAVLEYNPKGISNTVLGGNTYEIDNYSVNVDEEKLTRLISFLRLLETLQYNNYEVSNLSLISSDDGLWDMETNLTFATALLSTPTPTFTPTPSPAAILTSTPSSSSSTPPWLIGGIGGGIALVMIIGFIGIDKKLGKKRIINTQIKKLKVQMNKWRKEGYDVSSLEDLFK